ncbi:YceI family protein [Erwinia rhapontici]|uniref:YceI family protein n=1 Tax=Erwinia rhapontici TaxID=55212 RepID=UPI00133155AD|nr:YceI family protein [Erwinia rhapontici]MBP2154244.1 polyisoprenoid-binding protein YceI [Erwinia rhapontici]
MTRIAPVIAIGFLINPFSLCASPAGYSINTQKTTITLSWHAFGDASEARLGNVTGDIALNAGNEESDNINVSIPVATLKASNRLLTYQMKGSLFFDAGRYPNITFISSRVVALGQGHFRIFGTLAVKNVSRPVILDALLMGKNTGPTGAENIYLHASTTISRSAFNMDSFAALVDDNVTINIEIQARLHQAV